MKSVLKCITTQSSLKVAFQNMNNMQIFVIIYIVLLDPAF
jgi:hypothetical protein